tara:strand:+ start:319 stop:564 length:246 start_codon:yes stop_codon:yes gene_type:complete
MGSIKLDITTEDIAAVMGKLSTRSISSIELTVGEVDSEGIGYGPSITVHLDDRSIQYRYQQGPQSSQMGWEVVRVRHWGGE